jgi:hypothetical protein
VRCATKTRGAKRGLLFFQHAKNKKAGPRAGLKTSDWQLKTFSLVLFYFFISFPEQSVPPHQPGPRER